MGKFHIKMWYTAWMAKITRLSIFQEITAGF
jgi:hypothetical protein